MKRFFPILLAVMLVVLSAVPALAVDYNGSDLPDIESLWDDSGYTYATIYYTFGAHYVAFSDVPATPNDSGSATTILGNGVSYKLQGTSWVMVTTFTGNGMANFSGIIWTGERVCDGSSCPATDLNFDDVCDDCGMSLAYDLRVTPQFYDIVVKHSDTMTLLYRYTETLAGTTFNAVYSDDSITVSFDNPVNHEQFRLVDGEWVTHASYPNEYDNHAISLSADASIVSSDLDVYNTDGSFFFKSPLWMEMGQVTQGEMSNLTQTMGGTMKILVLCGVGLMASLVVLSLFGRRSLIFRR